jgi:hypothetical protein
MPAAERDPLSVYYDGYVWEVMRRAGAAGRHGRSVRVWIASPRREFQTLDKGGLTRHERAFQRSAYYLIFRTPINAKQVPEFSLKRTWSLGEFRPSSGGRLARPVTIRLFPRSQAKVRGRSWVDDPGMRSYIGEGGERVTGG